jgi:hypothetical protein
MEHRTVIQKTQAKFSTPLLLFGNREWNKNSNLVYAHSTAIIGCAKAEIRKQKSVFNYCSFGKNPLDKQS